MWLGVAAGLALLTWFIVLPAALAAQITLDDHLLVFNGPGWQNADTPQICRQVNTTMLSTNTSGDSVDVTFSGTSVIFWGPVTGNSLPVVVILDGVIQPLAAPQACTGGCGIIYDSGGLADTLHNITLLFPQASGTSILSICGVTVTSMPRFVQNPSSVIGQQNITSAPMMSAAASPTSSMITPEPSPPSVPTTAFITTRAMIIAIIGAIVGIIAAMSLLLFIFITVRGRITRHAARLKDREITREARNQGPKHPFSVLSSVCSNDDKSKVASVFIESGRSMIQAPVTVSIISTRSSVTSHRASGLGQSRTPSSKIPSIYTERSTTQNLGLVPGSPPETDNVYISSSQTEENPLLSRQTSKATSHLSIPIKLFSPRRRLSSMNTPASISPVFTTPRGSRTSDVFDPFSTPRASVIRIVPRKKHPPLESEESVSSAALSHHSRKHRRTRESPVRLSSII